MRIGLDARYIQNRYHGIGRYAFELLRGLSRVGPQHTYVVFWNPNLPNSRFDLRPQLEHPRIEAVAYGVPLYHPQDQFLLPILARRHRLDLFHVPYFAAPLLVPCPLVLTIHDLILDRYPAYMPSGWARRYYRTMMQLGVRRASGVVVVSEATRRDLVAHYHTQESKVVVAPLAADAGFRPVGEAEIAAVRQRYRVPDFFILHVGARRPHKNIEALVRALARIRDQVPHALVLVGEWDRRVPDPVPALVRQLGLEERIIEIKAVQEADLPALYGASTACVVPSLIEGFGLPVLEAFSCGVPVVTSNCSSMPEVAGDAALLVDPNSDESLAASLLKVLTMPGLRESLRERGLAQAARFTWERTASRTLALYQAIGQHKIGRQSAAPAGPA